MGSDRVKDDATVRREQLGRLLRQAREAAELTQDTVSIALGCRQAKINKMEKTLVGIEPADLDKLIALYRLPQDEAAALRELAELDRQYGPARTKYSNTMAAFNELTDIEPEAREIRCWHSERLPGPLQSEMYILKQHEPLITDPHQVTQVLRERTARTKVFTVANPPAYRVILSESALHRMPGGRNPRIVTDQVQHLIKLMDTYQQLEVRILTFDADVPWVDSDFEYLMFPDGGHCDFVYIEYPGRSKECKHADELRECRDHWNMLSAAALDVQASREFLLGLTSGGGKTAS
jgi:transcriptional regulator with XRE-family HTH domain